MSWMCVGIHKQSVVACLAPVARLGKARSRLYFRMTRSHRVRSFTCNLICNNCDFDVCGHIAFYLIKVRVHCTMGLYLAVIFLRDCHSNNEGLNFLTVPDYTDLWFVPQHVALLHGIKLMHRISPRHCPSLSLSLSLFLSPSLSLSPSPFPLSLQISRETGSCQNYQECS